MKKPLLFITTIMLAGLACASTDIAVDRKQIASIRSVAVLPFTAEPGIPADAVKEAEAAMKSAVIAAGFRLVERENMGALLKEKELSQAGITGERASSLGTLLGADGLLTGAVSANGESVRPVKDEKTGVTADKKFFRFQMAVRLVSVKNGAVVLTMQNIAPEAEQNPEFMGYGSLDAYRNLRIQGMRDDFIDAVKKK